MIRFQKMNGKEFEEYKAKLIKSYAETLSRNMRRSLEATMSASEQQINGLLPEGVDTENHYLFHVIDSQSGEAVGILWVNVKPEEHRAFIFDIEIKAEQQGKGYGKETMAGLETLMKEMKVKQIGLNVFADNPNAVKLYEKCGYVITNMNMVKELYK